MEWQDMITPAAFVNIIEKHFFPKWLQVLAAAANKNSFIANCIELDAFKVPPKRLGTPGCFSKKVSTWGTTNALTWL